jgi:transposase InsO family protein
MASMVRAVLTLWISVFQSAAALFRSRRDQVIVEMALRQQLAIYARRPRRPRLLPLDRAFWVALSHLCPRWKSALVVVQPETVVRWHQRRFRGYWRSISTQGPGPGRPPIADETKALIVRMATENRWRARKIQVELSKLGIRVSLATISRYLPKADPDPGSQQRWMSFLRNHRDVIAAMDFFVVPTVRFRLLYVWFALDHGRRRVLHYNVTNHPSARWVIQQLREAFPDGPTHRYLILDNDAIFSPEVALSIERFGICPKRTAFRSPWQNGTAERFVGSVRRELLDHVVVLGEDHLRCLLREYVEYYNGERVHTSIGDAPAGPTPRSQAFALRRGRRLPAPLCPPSSICLARCSLMGTYDALAQRVRGRG